MDRHASRLNHVALALLGLLLLAAGAAGLARGLGAFGSRAASDPLITDRMREFAQDQGWFWPAVVAAGVVLALLGLTWLLAQARSERLPGLSLDSGPDGGTTRLSGRAVTHALEDEVAEYPDVKSARAWLLGSSRRPRLRMNVSYREDTDLAGLRDRIDREAVARVKTALERESLPVAIRLRPVPAKDEHMVA